MTNVTACEIINQADKKYFTLYAEWFESHFKVMLLESTSTPLGGMVRTRLKLLRLGFEFNFRKSDNRSSLVASLNVTIRHCRWTPKM